MLAPWKKSYDKPRQHDKKQRCYFANKGLCSQGYGFSSVPFVNSGAVIIVVQACFPVWVSAGPVLSSGMSRWSDGTLPGLLTNLCTPLYPALPIYLSPNGVGGFPLLQAVSSIFFLETCS